MPHRTSLSGHACIAKSSEYADVKTVDVAGEELAAALSD
jgi:hypothetical protein